MATLPIHALFTVYLAEDMPLHSKQYVYIVTAVTKLLFGAAFSFVAYLSGPG